MSRRAALPAEAVSITPGYSWRLDLDILFAGERPDDWADWIVRMHVWSDCSLKETLSNGSGVTVEDVSGLPGADGPVAIPVIRLTGEQTGRFRTAGTVNYLIDLKAPEGDTEDYFYGSFQIVPGPPLEMVR